MVLFFNISTSQSNLIRNSSFESFSNQHNPSLEGVFDCYNPGYIQVVHDWDIINSPDHFDSAYTAGTYNVPFARAGNSYAKDGWAYTGCNMFAGNTETKEYIFQHLTSPLITGNVYCLSFFTTRADNITHSIHSIGAYFSSTPPTANLYLSYTPQIINQTGFITDTANWVEVRGCFTAQGGEQYITIGNFNSNANTDTLFVGATNPIPFANKYAYYYIDSVTLWRNNFPTGINNLANKNNLRVYPNPVHDQINFQFSNADEKRKVELYDVMGNLVLFANASTGNISFTTGNLSNGIYYYRVISDGKIVACNKIVIIR